MASITKAAEANPPSSSRTNQNPSEPSAYAEFGLPLKILGTPYPAASTTGATTVMQHAWNQIE